MSTSDAEIAALQSIVSALQGLEPAARFRIFSAVGAFFALPAAASQSTGHPTRVHQEDGRSGSGFSTDRTPTAKDFLFAKRPSTDVERIACLAYYLTHYQETPHFKTLELSKLNTEAAQPKFSNAAQAVDNATKAGLLVPAVKGAKQLSAAGELYVQALPDRQVAREALSGMKPKRKQKRTRRSTDTSTADDADL